MIVDTYKKQLSILNDLGNSLPTEYVCPFCLRQYTDASLISLEDAPQEALGGSKIALTCKSCNNRYGGLIDCHLVNYIVDSEDKKLPAGLNRPFIFNDPKTGQKVRGTLRTDKEKMEMVLLGKVNNPEILENEIKTIRPNSLIFAEMQTNQQKRVPQNIVAALLKNAYIILFSYFGYSFIANPFYNRIRQQIDNPSEDIIPDGLISREGVCDRVSDGVYVCDEKPLRGFFTVFTLEKREKHKYVVFIPGFSNSFEEAISRLREICKGDKVLLHPVQKDNGFWDNKEVIKAVMDWSLSSNMCWSEVLKVK